MKNLKTFVFRLRFACFILVVCGSSMQILREGLLPSASADNSPNANAYEQAALTNVGDLANGRKLFFEDTRTKCLVCHRVEDQGGAVGPDLTKIGGKFDRPHLIESLLEPSRQIVEGFRTSIIQTVDGRVLNGVVREQSDDRIKLIDANGKSIELETETIEESTVSDVSLMPSGLTDTLSTAEFSDLIAYLESLRSDGLEMGANIRGPIKLPQGFEVETVATGMTGAVAVEVLPDNRVLVCEQTGALRVIRDGKLLPEPFVTLPVHTEWERGLIGVTVDPDFEQSPYVYVCYVTKEPYLHHVVSRWLADGDVAKPGSEQILIEGDDQTRLGGNVPAGHQGGAIHFGPDGCLYIAIGDQTAGLPSQKLDTLQGKLLRIAADGSIPPDNPFVTKATGKYRSIWAYGLRNPFTFAIEPATGEILMNDVGGIKEEINRGRSGANYGWPTVEHGPTDDPRFVGPIHTYPQASISGGAFVPSDSDWPSEFQGTYFFADFVQGWIHAIDSSKADAVTANEAMTFAEGLRRPVDMRFGPDGSLYVLLRNAWVYDDKFESGTSALIKIAFSKQANSAAR
jgi:putative heme-binding domain-containing protein